MSKKDANLPVSPISPIAETNEESKETATTVNLDDISKEDLIGVISELQAQLEDANKESTYFVDPIELPIDDIINIMESTEFSEGSKLGAKLLGLYTTLANGGVPLEVASEIISNHHTLTMNTEALKIQSKTLKRSSGV